MSLTTNRGHAKTLHHLRTWSACSQITATHYILRALPTAIVAQNRPSQPLSSKSQVVTPASYRLQQRISKSNFLKNQSLWITRNLRLWLPIGSHKRSSKTFFTYLVTRRSMITKKFASNWTSPCLKANMRSGCRSNHSLNWCCQQVCNVCSWSVGLIWSQQLMSRSHTRSKQREVFFSKIVREQTVIATI